MNAKIVIRGNQELDFISSFLRGELSARGLLQEDSASGAGIPLSLQIDKATDPSSQGFRLDWQFPGSRPQQNDPPVSRRNGDCLFIDPFDGRRLADRGEIQSRVELRAQVQRGT